MNTETLFIAVGIGWVATLCLFLLLHIRLNIQRCLIMVLLTRIDELEGEV